MSIILNLSRSLALRAGIRDRRVYSALQRHYSKSYDYDGKTKIDIFNTQLEGGLMITGYSPYGFRLNTNMTALGPIAIFPSSILSWNVCHLEDVNEASLSLFTALEPKLDILIIGIGDEIPSRNFSKMILEFMKKYKVNTEILRTQQACATFNFLNAESRIIAAALIPPKPNRP